MQEEVFALYNADYKLDVLVSNFNYRQQMKIY